MSLNINIQTNESNECEPLLVDSNNQMKHFQQIIKLKSWFNQNYREYFEKLTRREAIGVSKPIVDPIRNKTYTTLNELYLEAEKVAEEIKSLEGE